MKIATRNVNGIRAVINKGFVEWVRSEDLDILCIQEPKAFESQLPIEVKTGLADYGYVWHGGTTPGYAGTAIFYKDSLPYPTLPYSASADISEGRTYKEYFSGYEQLSDDGRTTEITVGKLKIINCYFPNGSPRADGREMLEYKLRFYEGMVAYVQSCQAQGFEIILTGDFNICHRAIDIARPKENENSIGFLPIEREKIGWLMESCGLTDMFRHFYPTLVDKYTRRSYRAGARPRNVGRRLDYMMVSQGLVDRVISCEHRDQVLGSDHCPVVMEIDPL